MEIDTLFDRCKLLFYMYLLYIKKYYSVRKRAK